MKETIIVAGKNKVGVCRLRHCLKENGYDSIPCGSAEQIVEEMEILPTCDAGILLVVIGPEILEDIGYDLISKLSNFAPDVPFLLSDAERTRADSTRTFEKICKYRTRFRQEQNPRLAKALMDSGVEAVCSRENH